MASSGRARGGAGGEADGLYFKFKSIRQWTLLVLLTHSTEERGKKKETRRSARSVPGEEGPRRKGVLRDGRAAGQRGFKGEKENQGWLQFCKGLQTISAGLSGFGLFK